MASGYLPPRQKMINMMYLVLMAMLALNISRKVLSAFGYLNEKLETTNKTVSKNLEKTINLLKTKADEQPEKYRQVYDKALQIHEVSSGFYEYINDIKEVLLIDIEPSKRKDYESMEFEETGNVHFFTGDGLTENGKNFLKYISNYKIQIKEILGDNSTVYSHIENVLLNRFDTSPQDIGDGLKQPWLNNRYEGFPLVSTLTNLSVMQSDIKKTEKEIYDLLLGNQLRIDASINQNTYQAIVISDKPAYFEGEQFTGKVVLGRYDKKLVPEKVVINGKTIEERKSGAVIVKFRTRGVGENLIKGMFTFLEDGKKVDIPINSSYIVISKPESAVVSADKMNVVYRGIENPITISMAGITDDNLEVEAPGLRKVRGIGKYLLKPSKGKDIVLNVKGTTSDGFEIRSQSRFRIKDIPAPVASIRNQFGDIQLPMSSLQRSRIGAELVDFDFDLNLKVTSFKIKIPRQATIVVRGNRMNARAQKALAKVRRGDIVSIFDVKVSLVGNSSYKLKKVMPLSIEINN